MSETSNDIAIDDAILRTMTYFDIFNYPLQSGEICNLLDTQASKANVDEGLGRLVEAGQILKAGELYSLQFEPKLFERRIKGNWLADLLLPAVRRKANLIFGFPFVRAVMASGSFSKNFMEDKSDFDFFIVCAPNRIWISRMLLVVYKRLFLKNSHQQFCINYFVDTEHLEIDEKNIFTATELATVLPLTGSTLYNQLISANERWLKQTFPNYKKRTGLYRELKTPFLKRFAEGMLNVLLAQYLNRWFRNITLNRWRNRYENAYDENEFRIAFKSTEHVSKNHPRNFQKKIMDAYNKRVATLTKKMEVL